MARISSLAPADDLSEEGVWVDYLAGTRIRVGFVGRRAFKDYLAANTRNKRLTKRSTDDTGMTEEEWMVGAAKHLLLDWENFEEDDGSPIPYSPERALELFQDEKTKFIFLDVVQLATQLENFRREDEKEVSKN